MAGGRERLGEAQIGEFTAISADGEEVDPSHGVFPILTQRPNREMVAIGTGFFVAPGGIFVTAAHVVDVVIGENGENKAPLGLLHFSEGNEYFLRPIGHVTRHLRSDVAVGVAAPMHHNETGEPKPNPVLSLAANPPEVGSEVCTYAYPRTAIKSGSPQRVTVVPGFFAGRIEKHYPDGRDKMLPGPCFQTSIVVDAGASGGPVLVPGGSVVAVNSSGFKDDALSHVSCISEVFDLEIANIVLPGESDPCTTSLRKLSELGVAIIK